MLYKLSIANIKKSIRDYAIYFFTLILGVSIFYVFNSIESQTAMLDLSKTTHQLLGIMTSILSGVSVFVSFILGFLIIYASRFLIKKRNKEFGIYMTLGMSKRKISILLFLETLLIGIVSLVVGLLLGIGLSQVTSVFVANMFDANMTKFTFCLSESALIKTTIYFGIIYLIVMIFNTFIINKNKLIDLLQASKKSEKIKLKNPIVCTILFILSIIILGTAYYLVTDGIKILMKSNAEALLIPIGLGIVGTLIFFYSVSGLILRIVMNMKKLYYNGLNSFALRQISSKINTMVVSISMICIMLFITICVLSSSLSIKDYFNNSLIKLVPADLQIVEYQSDSDEDFTQIAISKMGIDYDKDFKDKYNLNVYADEHFTVKDSYGDYYEEILKQYPFMFFNNPIELITISDYNTLAKAFHFEEYSLEDDEYLIMINYEPDIYKGSLSKNTKINVFGNELHPKIDKPIDGFIEMNSNASNIGVIVVSDKVLKDLTPVRKIFIGNYKEYIPTNEEITDQDLFNVDINPKDLIYDASIGLSAIATFIGLYLGIIFLISSAAILALKELSDNIEDKEKYTILRKIGVDEKMINSSLFKQTLIFFMIPLTLALIHTIFGIKFCKFILSTMGITNITGSIIISILLLIFIYGGYFIITYWCSKNIIKNKI